VLYAVSTWCLNGGIMRRADKLMANFPYLVESTAF